MKIRAKLIENLEEYKEFEEKFIKKHPEARKALERMGDLLKAYIELDTGGQFDDQPKEAQEALKKALVFYVSEFGRLLLVAVNLDISAHFQGMKEMFGAKAIEAGLEEINNQMEVAEMMARSLEDDLD